jgi:outer membrane murein-binding lipoprotein Lpp
MRGMEFEKLNTHWVRVFGGNKSATMRRTVTPSIVLALALGCCILAGCSSPAKMFPAQEKFASVETFSRLFDASPAQACEAARRALLSQGYLVGDTNASWVEGKKNFQPDAESHLQMTIRVVCVTETASGEVSLAFASAVQDRYALKKDNSSASLGVSAIGSVSLPFMAGSDSMVKVGSETISSDAFYDKFFDLVKRYLHTAESGDK